MASGEPVRPSAPERIWLQDYGAVEPTWCADKINDEDVEYVRADMVDELAARALEDLAESVEHTGAGKGIGDFAGRMTAAVQYRDVARWLRERTHGGDR